MSAEEKLIATVLDATYAALSAPISTGKCKACGEIISPFVDYCLGCSGENEQLQEGESL